VFLLRQSIAGAEIQFVRIPRLRLSLRLLLVLFALVGFLLGAEQLRRRSEQFRKQRALCAFFEMKSRDYAAIMGTWDDLTIDEKVDGTERHPKDNPAGRGG
jgi:hypothetical protein